jgi:hypothetical protein
MFRGVITISAFEILLKTTKYPLQLKKLPSKKIMIKWKKMSKSYQLLEQDYENGDRFSVKILDRF